MNDAPTTQTHDFRAPRTRADLFALPEFANLSADSSGEPCIWRNQYHCDECDTEWSDEWSCQCDDDCSGCGHSLAPVESIPLIPQHLLPLWESMAD